MQNLKAEVTITIPKDMVLVNRVDYEDLKRQAEEVKTWSVDGSWISQRMSHGLKNASSSPTSAKSKAGAP